MNVKKGSKIKKAIIVTVVTICLILLFVTVSLLVNKVRSIKDFLHRKVKPEYPTELNIVAKNCDNNHGRTNFDDITKEIFIMDDWKYEWVMRYEDLPVELPGELVSQVAFLKIDAIPCDPLDKVYFVNNNKGTFDIIELGVREFPYTPYVVEEHKLLLNIPISDANQKDRFTFLNLELSRYEARIINAELTSIRHFQKGNNRNVFYVALSSFGSKLLSIDEYYDYIDRLNVELAPILSNYYVCKEVSYLPQCILQDVPKLLVEFEKTQNNNLLKSPLLLKIKSDADVLGKIKLKGN